MRNTTVQTMRKWMLGMTLVAGLLTTGAVAANAAPQEFRGRGGKGQFSNHVPRYGGGAVHEGGYRDGFRGGYGYGGGYRAGYAGGFGYGGGVVVNDYVPPCPGDGYIWTAGYYDGGIWIPGAWTFGVGRGFGGYAYGRGFEHRGFESRGYENRGFAYNHGGERGFNGGFHGRR